MTNLSDQQCKPVTHNDPKLTPDQIESFLSGELNHLWQFDARRSMIQREFNFKDYHQTIEFVNNVAAIIHQQDHHPEMHIGYNRCLIEFTTHSISNISINDFICAAKINQLTL